MQDILYDFEKIRGNFDKLVGILNAGSRSKLAASLGVGGTLAEYFKPEQKRNVSNLAHKLYETYGINQDWFLTGEGPIKKSEIEGRCSESIDFERIGRLMYRLFQELQRMQEK